MEGTLTPTTAGGEVTAGEGAGTHVGLHSVIGGIDFQITCGGFSTPGAKDRNVEEGGVMKVTGTGKAKFTGCAVVGGEKAKSICKVPESLETVELSLTTEEDKVVLKPKVGTLLITIPVTSVPGKTCPALIVGEREFKGIARGWLRVRRRLSSRNRADRN